MFKKTHAGIHELSGCKSSVVHFLFSVFAALLVNESCYAKTKNEHIYQYEVNTPWSMVPTVNHTADPCKPLTPHSWAGFNFSLSNKLAAAH